MPQYQLTAAVALAVGLIASLAAWSLATGKKATNAFPIPEDGATGLLSDPFDVTKPEDFIDGIPVDETRFWMKVVYSPTHKVYHTQHTIHDRCGYENSRPAAFWSSFWSFSPYA